MHFHHWFLRLPFAAAFFYHGAGKIAVPAQSAAQLDLSVGLTVLVGIAEILAAVGALWGGFARLPLRCLAGRLAGLAALPVLIGAIALVHFPRYSFVPSESHPWGGMEYQLMLLGVALWLLFAPCEGTDDG